MNNLIVKSVDLMGDTVMAAQDNEGTIWVAVRWMCNALDMTEGQMKRQIKNIQEDELFSGSGSNQILNKGSGERDVFCLKLDYVPIWLAKISISKKTREERPEFSKKLLKYQLKAKDILAEAFLPNGGKVPKTIPEQIQLLAQGNVELNQRVDAVDKRVEELGEKLKSELSELPILGLESDKITTATRRKGVFVLGGKESAAYKDKSLRTKVYNNIYANLKYNFGGIKTYKAIKRNQCDKALEIIEKYEPPVFLKEQIDSVNNQMVLDLEQEVRYEK